MDLNQQKDMKLFHLCRVYLEQRNYAILDEIMQELKFYDNRFLEVTPSLLTSTLLSFIYYKTLSPELKIIYFNLKNYLIDFYQNNQKYFFDHHKYIYEKEPDSIIHHQIISMIYQGLFDYTNDSRFVDYKSMTINELEKFIDTLYTSRFSTLMDIELYGLILACVFLDDNLSSRGKDEFNSYIWFLLSCLITHEGEIFNLEEDNDIPVNKKFQEELDGIDLIP